MCILVGGNGPGERSLNESAVVVNTSLLQMSLSLILTLPGDGTAFPFQLKIERDPESKSSH